MSQLCQTEYAGNFTESYFINQSHAFLCVLFMLLLLHSFVFILPPSFICSLQNCFNHSHKHNVQQKYGFFIRMWYMYFMQHFRFAWSGSLSNFAIVSHASPFGHCKNWAQHKMNYGNRDMSVKMQCISSKKIVDLNVKCEASKRKFVHRAKESMANNWVQN